jgi:predicted Zn-dependent protease
VPVIVIDGRSKGSQLLVRLPKVKEWAPMDVDSEMSKKSNRILKYVFEVQRLLKTGQRAEALQLSKKITSDNPNVAQLQFLHASVLFANGMKTESKAALELALKYDPENIDALQLKKLLGASI